MAKSTPTFDEIMLFSPVQVAEWLQTSYPAIHKGIP